jgi:tRNA A-37 threonylcarbamoyl transferase component Bud32
MNELLDSIRAEQRREWQSGRRLPVEHYIALHPELQQDDESTLDLICSEKVLREESGERVAGDEYIRRFPHLAEKLRRQLMVDEWLDQDLPTGGLEGTTLPLPTAADDRAATLDAPPTPAAKAPSIPGYDVLHELGRGTFGVVYKVRQESLNRVLALKMLRGDVDEWMSEGRPLFRREAETVAKIRHPHIVELYDINEHEGRLYYTMEYVEGGTLEKKLKDGPLPPRAAAELVEKVALAVQKAHEANIVHRDLKPGNVLLDKEGSPKVADFGLAKWLNSDASLMASTAIVGTPSYMAPEQTEGKLGKIGTATDVWGLGVILYQTLTGKLPFEADDTVRLFAKIRSDEPVPPRKLRREVPRELETICLKCLEKDGKKRYANAGMVAERLRRVMDGKPIPERPRGWLATAWRSACRHPYLLGLVAGVLCAAVAVAVIRPGKNTEPPKIDAKTALETTGVFQFTGDTVYPRPLRWPLGSPEKVEDVPEAGYFTVQSLAKTLFEIVDDPLSEHYQFGVDIRHEVSAGASEVGLYFGFQQGQQSQASFLTVSYGDRHNSLLLHKKQDGETASWVTASAHCFAGKPDDVPDFALRNLLEFEPALPWSGPAPWRRIEIEVLPEVVRVSWRAAEDGPMNQIGMPLERKRLDEALRGHLRVHQNLAFLPTKFNPRSGLGLYVSNGKASFRRIMIRRLD